MAYQLKANRQLLLSLLLPSLTGSALPLFTLSWRLELAQNHRNKPLTYSYLRRPSFDRPAFSMHRYMPLSVYSVLGTEITLVKLLSNTRLGCGRIPFKVLTAAMISDNFIASIEKTSFEGKLESFARWRAEGVWEGCRQPHKILHPTDDTAGSYRCTAAFLRRVVGFRGHVLFNEYLSP